MDLLFEREMWDAVTLAEEKHIKSEVDYRDVDRK